MNVEDEGASSGWADIICANDWNRRSFLLFNLMVLMVLFFTFIFEQNGMKIPFTREIAAIVLITFLPGFSILKLARIRNICAIKSMVLAASISILITMCTGTLLDILGRYIGMEAPLTEMNVLVANSAVALVLALIAYAKEQDRPLTNGIKFPNLTALEIVIISFPFLAYSVATYASRTGDGLPQLLLYIGIAAMVSYLGVGKNIPHRVFPLAVFCLSLTILIQSSMVSRYMVEWADVSFEFWSAKHVILNGWWNPMEFGRTNSVLSITILAPTYSLISGIDLVAVFKIVFPLLFCIVPLVVYEFARSISRPKTAFLAAFLLIGCTCYFTEMLGLNRQIIAEVFMACFILVLLMDGIGTWHKGFFLAIFGLGITFSHYGLMMIFLSCLVMAGVLSLVVNRFLPAKAISKRMIIGFSIFLIAVAYLWYNLVINSYMFKLILRVVDQLIRGLTEFQGSRESIIYKIFSLDQLNLSQLCLVLDFYFILIFTIIGIVKYASMIKRGEGGRTDYLTVCLSFLAAITAGAYSPNIFGAISEERLYHVSMIVLAPLIPLGIYTIMKMMNKRKVRFNPKVACHVLLTLFVVVSFLFYSGAVNSMIGQSTAFPLDPDKIDRVNYTDSEYLAAMWGFGTIEEGSILYGDAYQAYLMQMYFDSYGPLAGRGSVPFITKYKEYYFFFGEANVNGHIWLEDASNPRLNKSYEPMPTDFISLVYKNDLVYCSQGATIYYHKT